MQNKVKQKIYVHLHVHVFLIKKGEKPLKKNVVFTNIFSSAMLVNVYPQGGRTKLEKIISL